MKGYQKGVLSRERLISQSREIFNESGLNITLSNLAQRLGITLGMLTYHFSTKDHLFIAIAEEYEMKFAELSKRMGNQQLTLQYLITYAMKVMDLQYEYRCAIRYVTISSKNQTELSSHINDSYRNSKESILQMVQALVKSGELNDSLLNESNFRIFLFCFSCLFTSWPFILEIYDNSENYTDLKPIYLRGIFSALLELDESISFA